MFLAAGHLTRAAVVVIGGNAALPYGKKRSWPCWREVGVVIGYHPLSSKCSDRPLLENSGQQLKKRRVART
jgi:hypothetical protein